MQWNAAITNIMVHTTCTLLCSFVIVNHDYNAIYIMEASGRFCGRPFRYILVFVIAALHMYSRCGPAPP